MIKGPKILIVVDSLRIVGQKVNFDLLTDEEKEEVSDQFGESDHLFSIVPDVFGNPSRWFTSGAQTKWDRRVDDEIESAFRQDPERVIVELPIGKYHIQPLTYKGAARVK